MPSKYRYPVRRSPKSDPQQYRVYRMENEAIGARSYQQLSRARIGQLVRSISQNYGVPCPRLVWKNLGRWAAEWTEPGEIALNTRKNTAKDVLTITHEMAHHVHFHFGGESARGQENHGPEFMAVHMSILDTCRVVPVVGMRAICQQYRLRFEDPGTRNSLKKLKRIARGNH